MSNEYDKKSAVQLKPCNFIIRNKSSRLPTYIQI